jgi:hypothetical protein
MDRLWLFDFRNTWDYFEKETEFKIWPNRKTGNQNTQSYRNNPAKYS